MNTAKKNIVGWDKIPWHNSDECRSKMSLLAKTKYMDLDSDSNTDAEKERGKHIIDAEPSSTIATTKI